MKFEEVIDKLATKNAIKRSANIKEGFRGDISTKDLLSQKTLFLNQKRIEKECCKFDDSFDFRRYILFLFLNEEEYMIKSDLKFLVDKIKKFKRILFQNEKYIHTNNRNKEIYQVVLEAIMEDRKISKDEINVLEKLRKKLGISLLQHWLFRIKNDFFDEINEIDTMPDRTLKRYLHDLERGGILFYIPDFAISN